MKYIKAQTFFLFFIFVVGLCVWQFGNYSFVMSSPMSIVSFIISFLQTKLFWSNFLKTFMRVVISCVFALLFGVTLALLKNTTFNFAYKLMYGSQFISSAVLTILFIVLFGLNPLIPVWVVTIVIIPNIYVATEIGLRNLNMLFMDIGKLYSRNKLVLFRYIILPQLAPYIMNGFIRAHAIAWKVVITAELFVVAKGLGYLLNNYFRLMEFEKLFGITIIIIFVGVFFDNIIRKIKEVYIRDYNREFE